MKIILPIIVLLIIIILCIIIFNNNIYFSENFTGTYDQNTIEDLIPASYIPFNPYLVNKSSEYEVIDIYKKILNRSPSTDEIENKIFLSKDELTEELYNSYEYDRLIKIQDNLAINDIEQTIAHNNLMKKITIIYKNIYNKDPDARVKLTLNDCYIHLRNNIFLFLAFLQSTNYIKFELEILTTKNLTKSIILEIFNKYFNLLELKLIAEDKIKSTRGDISLSIQTSDVNFVSMRDDLSKILTDQANTSNIQQPTAIPIATTPTPTPTQNTPLTPTDYNNIINYLQSSSNVVEPFNNSTYIGVNSIYDKTKVGNIFRDDRKLFKKDTTMDRE